MVGVTSAVDGITGVVVGMRGVVVAIEAHPAESTQNKL
jgi:hypothetical protein